MSTTTSFTNKIKGFLPILEWAPKYSSQTFSNDIMVAVIVTVMLIPQSLAYAQLAGLPSQVGLYASMIPLIVYAIFGTSRSLSVGPVAITSLLTAAAIAPLAALGSAEYLTAAIALALMAGFLLIVMGLLKLGFVANFLSKPVMSGFITASSMQIAASQLIPILGLETKGDNFVQIVLGIFKNVAFINPSSAAIGFTALILLVLLRKYGAKVLELIGLNSKSAATFAKLGPIVVIVVTILAVWLLNLTNSGVKIVGEVPKGLPSLQIPTLTMDLLQQLLVPAILIAVLGYIGSISVAQTLAAKKRQRVDPDQELIALGASNIGSAISGGFPVTGGFSRSVVNFDAGAETPAAGAFTAIGIALVALFLTPLLFFLPNATLAATIFISILSLIDFKAFKTTFTFSFKEGALLLLTFIITLSLGVKMGLVIGVLLSLLMHLYATSRPHIAIIGQLKGSEQFRNKERREVVLYPEIISLRFDESIYFPNVSFLEDRINKEMAQKPEAKHLILSCPAINTIDFSGILSLMNINKKLQDSGVTLHLSEVKGPIDDLINKSKLKEQLTGKIYRSHFEAVSSINSEAINTRDSK